MSAGARPACWPPARVALLLLLPLLAGCGNGCQQAPTIPTVAWEHAGAGGGTACQESPAELEPNDTVSSANTLPGATCSPLTFDGGIATDVDVFRTSGPRCDDGASAPRATLTSSDPTVRLCLFSACVTGKTGLTGCISGVPTHLPAGMLGCCANTAPGFVALQVDCDADVQFGGLTPASKKPALTSYVVVDRASGTGCAGYTVTLSY